MSQSSEYCHYTSASASHRKIPACLRCILRIPPDTLFPARSAPAYECARRRFCSADHCASIRPFHRVASATAYATSTQWRPSKTTNCGSMSYCRRFIRCNRPIQEFPTEDNTSLSCHDSHVFTSARLAMANMFQLAGLSRDCKSSSPARRMPSPVSRL